MTPWIQTIIALTIVALAVIVVIYQATSAMRGKRSKLGSCCAKGCQAPKSEGPEPERVVFFPSDMLIKRK